MNRMKLGRRKYQILRHIAGGYNEDGLWMGDTWMRIDVRAGVHGGLFWNAMKHTEAGESSKQAISVRCDVPLYQASPAGVGEVSGKKADIFLWDGSYWEVRDCRKYDNIRNLVHHEAMCVRLDESALPREVLEA